MTVAHSVQPEMGLRGRAEQPQPGVCGSGSTPVRICFWRSPRRSGTFATFDCAPAPSHEDEYKPPARGTLVEMMELGQVTPAVDRINRGSTLFVAILLTGGLVGGCPNNPPPAQREFFRQSLAEQHRVFRTLEPSEQVDVYITAQLLHASDASFCRDLAETSGSAAITPLKEALSRARGSHDEVAALQGLECIAKHDPSVCDRELCGFAEREAMQVPGLLRFEAEKAVSGMPCAEGDADE